MQEGMQKALTGGLGGHCEVVNNKSMNTSHYVGSRGSGDGEDKGDTQGDATVAGTSGQAATGRTWEGVEEEGRRESKSQLKPMGKP